MVRLYRVPILAPLRACAQGDAGSARPEAPMAQHPPGDQVGGDKVAGNVYHTTIVQPSAPLTPEERENRRAMLDKVRLTWIEACCTSRSGRKPASICRLLPSQAPCSAPASCSHVGRRATNHCPTGHQTVQ